VLAFPCNQFAGQEPGTDAEILEFATSTYNVTFPMFHKIDVNGDNACDLYRWLRAELPGAAATNDITWNFEKFLVNRRGEVVARFAPSVTPAEIALTIPEFLVTPV
jgi:glutathione peroxidase